MCAKTFGLYQAAPYAEHFEFVEPLTPVDAELAVPFDCSRTARRHPRETKGQDYTVTTEAQAPCCGPDGCC